ncbi:hypothetical protein [Phycisphaera mikurensis]|uniref:Uncharacterized protein n=1 Tax=Phycisphaera mikurensis (strain NBRC 102666 / KCTC 22515 / FYK2301M01) TaxID=1142394 RepID=I0IDB4_PHYMF|nr:hypothetical protein [Phycisphaera mikurensis]MBB6442377.1 hypothetical protein [Phycisphaera mikurensis]BAM03252.1 hypothetical protein PSMK_10930 [Phycisphaera mikurensis NBRC 102666]
MDRRRQPLDLRGIDELRTEAMADAVAALGDPGGEGAVWHHGFSHGVAGGGAATLVAEGPAGIRVRIRLAPGDAGAPPAGSADAAGGSGGPTTPTRLISATVLKLRRQGHGVIRLEPDAGADAAPGWDGRGWLQRLGDSPADAA